jgi:hypothetical protein
MRIVHAAHYSLTRDGSEFFNYEYKFHTGLCQAGHYVYPFSINDRARWNILKSKTLGKGFANKCLITCCKNVEPDFLLLGHAQYIRPETLAIIRQNHPAIKIALWYMDPVYPDIFEDYSHIFPKIPYLDAFFSVVGGPNLQQFNQYDCRAAYIPNPVDRNIERLHVDRMSNHEYDMIYIGSDKNHPERRQFLEELVRKGAGLRFGFAGCLGYPTVWGGEVDDMIAKSLTALNYTIRNDVPLMTSDRIVRMMGNGICTLTPRSSHLQELYESEKEIIYFDSVDDLVSRINDFTAHPHKARLVGEMGRKGVFARYSANQIADYICKFTFNDPQWKDFSWSKFACC